MRIVEDFPYSVREIENCWIPMSDGCRLAARIWLPEGAETQPVPAIVEYIPYRKRYGTRGRDEPMHRYFAGHGYAALRIDLRGSGESDGLLKDEYLEQEQNDGLEAIRWIASQPWCTGAVGMMGKSWGGFNSLQIAARRPPQLKAIITVCSTDDRYRDDAHYMGGCLLNENLIWGSVLLTINAQPPDPELVGARWREMWLERLKANALFPAIWMRHQKRDEYWRHGSICEDWSGITCPVYAISGWADGYTNAVPRLLAGLKVPRKGLVGPWAHVYPHEGVPGPAIGFLQEALRWWDQWLRGIDTGIMDEPMYRAWMQESERPATFYQVRRGRWVAEAEWPSARIEPRVYRLLPGRLVDEDEDGDGEGEQERVQLRSKQVTGLAAGSWCGFGVEGEMPTDQREDDGRSLVFDTLPLTEKIEILGAPVIDLKLSVDRAKAFIAVRLNDVAPDGSSTRVSYGLLNLAHRESHEEPESVIPGESYEVRVKLNDAAHAFAPGHSIRIALSTTYWPLVWPSPAAVTLSVGTGGSALQLPVRPARHEDAQLRPFERPEIGPPLREIDIHPGGSQRTIEHDPATHETVYTTRTDFDDTGDVALTLIEEINLAVGHAVLERFRIREDDPLSASAEIEHRTVIRRDSWSTAVRTVTRLTATAEEFRLQAELEAFEGEKQVFSERWQESIGRDFV